MGLLDFGAFRNRALRTSCRSARTAIQRIAHEPSSPEQQVVCEPERTRSWPQRRPFVSQDSAFKAQELVPVSVDLG